MLLLITIVFMGILGYVYWKAAIYAAPFLMAFVFGKFASALGAHWITIAIAALIGVLVMYFILAFLRELGKTYPLAMWAERLLVFGPSFYFTFSVVNYLMRNEWERGAIESTFVSVIAGLGLGVLAYSKYVQQSVSWESQS